MVDGKPIIVAEFTTNHMGNLNVLLRMVEMAKWAGADIIKMQKKDVSSFYTKEKLEGGYASPYGETYYDYRRIFEFGKEDFERFDTCCKENEIPWYVTIQDTSSINFFKDFDLPMVKIASCNTGNKELISGIKEAFPDIPFVFSIGGTSIEKIDEIVEMVSGEIYIQQCTSTYPCPPEQLFLGNIPVLLQKYTDPRIHIGYSGHENGWYSTLLAAAMGAETIERHFCLSRHSFVHHVGCSLEPSEFKEMTETIRQLPMIQSTNFGMKDSERKFLVENTYGTDELQGDWTCFIL